MAGTSSLAPDIGRAARGSVRRLGGALIGFSALAVAISGAVALTIINDNLHKDPSLADKMSSAALAIVRNRIVVASFTLPALVCGLAMLTRRMSPAAAWLCIACSVMSLLATLALVLYAFLAMVAPLYQYEPL